MSLGSYMSKNPELLQGDTWMAREQVGGEGGRSGLKDSQTSDGENWIFSVAH